MVPLGDQPRALGPHLDYYPDNAARVEFHETYGPAVWLTNQTEANILMGDFDGEGMEFKILLGVWKPLSPNPICDYPLAAMDASTARWVAH